MIFIIVAAAWYLNGLLLFYLWWRRFAIKDVTIKDLYPILVSSFFGPIIPLILFAAEYGDVVILRSKNRDPYDK